MGRHQKKDIEIGGRRYVLMACGSDQSFFGLRYVQAELLHLYVAMGLREDHALQTTYLACVLDHRLASEVIRAAKEMLGYKRVVVSAIPQEEVG